MFLFYSLLRLLGALMLSSPALADGWVDNVDGMTINNAGAVVHFAGFTVTADGKIGMVIRRGDKAPVRPEWRFDGKGAVLLPGLIDGHGHVVMTGFGGVAARAGVQSLARERDLALVKAQDDYFARGFTTVADMGTSIDDWNAFRRAGDEGRLRLRILAYSAGITPMASIGGGLPTPWLYHDHLRMAGVALNADAGPDQTKLKNLISRASMDGFQVAVTGDAEQVVGAIEDVALTYRGDRRWRIEGAGAVDPARRAKAGIIVGPVDQPDRTTWLAAMTTDAAFAGFAETKVGRIAPGYAADFIMVDRASLEGSGALRILQTWIAGSRVFKAP